MEEFNHIVRNDLVKAFLLLKELNKVFMDIDNALGGLSERERDKRAESDNSPDI